MHIPFFVIYVKNAFFFLLSASCKRNKNSITLMKETVITMMIDLWLTVINAIIYSFFITQN